MTEYDGSTALTCDWRPDGMRGWKDNGSTTTYFYYDLRGVPVLEEQSGAITAINTFGPNGLISRGTNSTNEVYYQFDERGDTVTRSDDTGTVLEYHGSDTFGDQFSSGSTTDPYLGFGAQWGYYGDSEIGLFLLGHRYYDQGNARFLNRDPIGYAGGINGYSYGDNNPTDEVDSDGLDPGYWEQAWGFFEGEARAINPYSWVAGPAQALGYIAGQGWSGQAFLDVGSQFLNGLEFWNKDDAGAAGESFMGDVLLVAPLVKHIPNFTPFKITGPFLQEGGGVTLCRVDNLSLPKETQRWRLDVNRLPDENSIPKWARKRVFPHYHRRPGIGRHRPFQGW